MNAIFCNLCNLLSEWKEEHQPSDPIAPPSFFGWTADQGVVKLQLRPIDSGSNLLATFVSLYLFEHTLFLLQSLHQRFMTLGLPGLISCWPDGQMASSMTLDQFDGYWSGDLLEI